MVKNAQHSASSGDYGTPPWIVEIAHEVLEGIDVDVASSEEHNEVVKAYRYFNSDLPVDDSVGARNWFCNPPGSCDKVGGVFSVCGNVKRCSCNLPREFFNFCNKQDEPVFWVGFNLNQLRTLPWRRGALVCVLNHRVEYLVGGVPRRAPSHDSFLALMASAGGSGGRAAVRFCELLKPCGKLMEVF